MRLTRFKIDDSIDASANSLARAYEEMSAQRLGTGVAAGGVKLVAADVSRL